MSAPAVAQCPTCEAGMFCPSHYKSIPEPTPGEIRKRRISELAAHWLPYLKGKAPAVEEVRGGPLFTAPPEGHTQSAPLLPTRFFVTGFWETIVFHIEVYSLALQFQGIQKRPTVAVITDMELIERRFDRNPEKTPFSRTIAEPGFLVLRLGFQASANTELPKVLWEALRVREANDLPVVLVCEPFRPWTRSHPAWSDDLDKLLEARFIRAIIR